jgi:hypothetical protein
MIALHFTKHFILSLLMIAARVFETGLIDAVEE